MKSRLTGSAQGRPVAFYGGMAEWSKATHLGASYGQPYRRFESFLPPPLPLPKRQFLWAAERKRQDVVITFDQTHTPVSDYPFR
jgi:hypothetical protein